MTIFKCKICGGSLEIENQSVTVCEYCGTKQALPKLDDERKANLYDRANHFRRNNDFDKALGIYETILNEDTTDADAYWSIVLCRYGIEYVEDPATHKRVPTVNRAQFTSIFDDEDYKSAIRYADEYQREIYQEEAKVINDIQKSFLDISQKEEPFDVFICYKESDQNGRRTQDSVLATELYNELTREGFKVFFSRITLEDKLGIAYEPYIFAALHSSKVMVVLGTRADHFNAVWVKNEWSRYLALIKGGAKKTLIPAYKDMDPYDMPEEFSHLQAQDMSRLGFMQDLIRGIKKLTKDTNESLDKTVVTTVSVSSNIAPMIKRIYMFLEDEEFDRADELCEMALNQDPENAEVYVCKLLAETRLKNQDMLASLSNPLNNNKNYQRALRFASSSLSEQLQEYNEAIRKRNEEMIKNDAFKKAISYYQTNDISKLLSAIDIFNSLGEYKESYVNVELCKSKIEKIKDEEKRARAERERLAEEQRIKTEQRLIEMKKIAKKHALIAAIFSISAIAVFTIVFLISSFVIKNKNYNEALNHIESGNYESACSILCKLDSFKNSETLLKESQDKILPHVNELVGEGEYSEAFEKLKLIGFDDSSEIYTGYRQIALGNWNEGIKTLKLEHFIIPKNCTEIKDCAFQYCDTLKSVTFPKKLESIGANAFIGCTAMEEIVIPEGVTFIGTRAFAYCESLKSVTLPDGLLTIDSYAFANCNSLTEIYVPDSVTRVGVFAFAYNRNLLSLRLGTGLTAIKASTAIGCTKLETVILGNNITEIGGSAFEDCTSLEGIRLPSYLKSIGSAAFRNCSSLNAIKIPANTSSIGAETFSGCSALTKIIFTNSEGWKANGLECDVSSEADNVIYFTVTNVSCNWSK